MCVSRYPPVISYSLLWTTAHLHPFTTDLPMENYIMIVHSYVSLADNHV